VSKELALAGWEARSTWRREGPAPIMLEEFEVTRRSAQAAEMSATASAPGRAAGARAARPLQPLHAARREAAPELVTKLATVGARSRTQLDRATARSRCRSQQRLDGIEPSFAHITSAT